MPLVRTLYYEIPQRGEPNKVKASKAIKETSYSQQNWIGRFQELEINLFIWESRQGNETGRMTPWTSHSIVDFIQDWLHNCFVYGLENLDLKIHCNTACIGEGTPKCPSFSPPTLLSFPVHDACWSTDFEEALKCCMVNLEDYDQIYLGLQHSWSLSTMLILLKHCRYEATNDWSDKTKITIAIAVPVLTFTYFYLARRSKDIHKA